MKYLKWLYIASFMISASCTSSKITSSRRSPETAVHPYTKILVLGLAGYTSQEFRENGYRLTTNGVDGYKITFINGVWYSSKDQTFSDQLRAELLKAGYQLQKNKEEYKNDVDHFEYSNGKLQIVFFKSKTDEEYNLVMKKI